MIGKPHKVGASRTKKNVKMKQNMVEKKDIVSFVGYSAHDL